MNVRVRGVYATALTRLLADAGLDVVQASAPIRRRFDAAFAVAEHDVRVETTADRQGVEISGTAESVAAVSDALDDVGEDTFLWDDPLPQGAVHNGVVERTVGGGAVVNLDGGEGYLPFGNAEERVEEGDRLRVQVRDPAAPWSDDRAVLDTAVRIEGGVASLVWDRDATVARTPDGSADHELAGLTEMLPTDVPERWAVEWERPAADADMDALDAALDAAAETAADIEAALTEAGDPGEPTVVVSPRETAWTWFGRESRFALDDVRADVVSTMAGHHRVKAGADGASDAVDFVEAVCGGVSEFPVAPVLETFGPDEGDTVALEHGKPDGSLFTLGRGTVVDRDAEAGTVTVRREMTSSGTYDALGVKRTAGDTATTRFVEGRRWYPTVYRSEDGEVKGTYVNVCTPVEMFPGRVRYVDLHVDVVKHADGDVEVVDEDELAAAVAAEHVPEPLADEATDVAERVASGLRD